MARIQGRLKVKAANLLQSAEAKVTFLPDIRRGLTGAHLAHDFNIGYCRRQVHICW
jgi:hypothetical protein